MSFEFIHTSKVLNCISSLVTNPFRACRTFGNSRYEHIVVQCNVSPVRKTFHTLKLDFLNVLIALASSKHAFE